MELPARPLSVVRLLDASFDPLRARIFQPQIGGNRKDLLPQASTCMVDRRLRCCSAASRDRIGGIDGTEEVVTSRPKVLLHEMARFDTARLIVIAF